MPINATGLNGLLNHIVSAWLLPCCWSCNSVGSEFCEVCTEQISWVTPGSVAYVGPIADIIRRAKYGPDTAIARGFSKWWATNASGVFDSHVISAVSAIPSHWTRRLMRGFDLSAECGTALADELGHPFVRTLTASRRDPSLAASASKEERSRLVEGRFSLTRAAAALQGTTILLVDDVMTTGATMGEACRVLRAANISVVACTVACTPDYAGAFHGVSDCVAQDAADRYGRDDLGE